MPRGRAGKAAGATARPLTSFPITTHFTPRCSGIGLAWMLSMLGRSVYGFYTSLGGQPLFGRASLEE